MPGLICALEDWQHFLKGLPEPFKVITNHKNMEWWAFMCDLTHRQAHWALYLSRFHFMIKNKKGSQMQADALSQSPLHGIPKKIVSNWGPQFALQIMCSILKQLGIDAGLIMAYHLQANGQTKHKNQEIE